VPCPENGDRTRILDGDDAERAAAALAGGTEAGVVSRGGGLGAAGLEPETRASCRTQCASDPGTGIAPK
jgi:hypothetical protein